MSEDVKRGLIALGAVGSAIEVNASIIFTTLVSDQQGKPKVVRLTQTNDTTNANIQIQTQTSRDGWNLLGQDVSSENFINEVTPTKAGDLERLLSFSLSPTGEYSGLFDGTGISEQSGGLDFTMNSVRKNTVRFNEGVIIFENPNATEILQYNTITPYGDTFIDPGVRFGRIVTDYKSAGGAPYESGSLSFQSPLNQVNKDITDYITGLYDLSTLRLIDDTDPNLPIFSMKGRLDGYEALVRPEGPEAIAFLNAHAIPEPAEIGLAAGVMALLAVGISRSQKARRYISGFLGRESR